MRYHLKPIFCRPWLLNGLSLKLIESHYENNYGGALKRLNAITEQLESLDFAKTPGYVLNGLKREELVALELHPSARALFRQPRRRGQTDPDDGRRACPRFRLRGPLARRIRRDGQRPRRRLGVGAPRLRTARPPAREPVRRRAQPGRRRRHPARCPRHVRACLPHGFRCQREGLRGRIHAESRLESGRGALRGCVEGRAAATAGSAGVRRSARGRRRGGEGDAGFRQARSVHRRQAEALRFPHAGHHRRRHLA